MTHRLRQLDAMEGCQLWLADLDAPAAPQEFDCLSADELARAGRFTFARHRHRFMAGRAALRQLLARRIGQPAGALEFSYGPHGKPFLDGAFMPAFNMSHSDGIGLVALADEGSETPPGAIGVDVEMLRAMSDAPALAAANFEPEECEALVRLQEPARSKAFLIGWTRKEACLKALGSGFSGPARLATGLAMEARSVTWQDGATGTPHHASVRSFELPGHLAVAALARLQAPVHAPSAATALAALMST
jgi:4'-phosphopantetheinyl transferase